MEGGQRRATMGVGGVAGVLGLVNIPSKQKPPHIQRTVDTRAANAPSVLQSQRRPNAIIIRDGCF